MPVFPQFVTGAVALYPVSRETRLRTVVNRLADGSTVVLSDPEGTQTAWELRATGLTAAEWNAIEALFKTVSGQWETFTLLDPTGNLLANSEDFSVATWTNGPLIQLTPGVADPQGTNRATRVVNAGQAAQAVAQTLAVPANYEYSISVWARTAAGSAVTLLPAGVVVPLGTTWKRISARVNGVTFGVQLDPGASVELFGMQVEAQLAPSDYKKTGETGGVRTARFAEDAFTVRAQSTDVYDVTVRMVSAG